MIQYAQDNNPITTFGTRTTFTVNRCITATTPWVAGLACGIFPRFPLLGPRFKSRWGQYVDWVFQSLAYGVGFPWSTSRGGFLPHLRLKQMGSWLIQRLSWLFLESSASQPEVWKEKKNQWHYLEDLLEFVTEGVLGVFRSWKASTPGIKESNLQSIIK